jgi:DUF1009 family protein
MKKLGIIAAKGDLSSNLIAYAKEKFELFIVAIKGETDPSIIENLESIWINIGEIGKAIDAMKAAKVDKIVFVGSLQKPDIFSLKVDMMGAKLLAKITKDKLFGDNSLLSSLTEFLENEGLKVVGVHEILKNLVVEAGNFTNITPNKNEDNDIELAMKLLKELGKFDVGQGAIIENGVVLGVEALEGTDNLIKRCAELKLSKAQAGILVKLSKPGQELRMDLPTIGITTIKNMHKAGFKGIVIEAKKTIFLDQEEVVKYTNKHGMFLKAIH